MSQPTARVVVEFQPPAGLRVDGPEDVIVMLGLLELARFTVYQRLRGGLNPTIVVPPATAG